ncbi:MAG: MFS family permease [Paracoccaceae bacterium]|jgi:MFS family permease
MQNRWFILFVLFFARTTMAFQFQSVAALSPLIIENLAATLVDIGLLIGLYLGPGVIVATLGGTVAGWFGDKRTVFASLVLMVAGSVLVAYGHTLSWVMTGRVVSGVGGVVVNVVMTKMVIDWFAGRNVATALSIFISSYPLGIALALLVLPRLAEVGGLDLAWGAVSVATALAMILFGMVYRTPPGAVAGSVKLSASALPWLPLTSVAVLWGLYNAAFAMIFGFGTLILVGRGLSVTDASSATSIHMLTGTVAIPLGGWIADRTGRRYTVILVSLISGVVLFPALLYLPVSYAGVLLGLGGLFVGLSPGPIVSLPSYILPPQARAFGTGVFYSMYYALMMIAPPMAGAIADRVNDVSVAFLLGSGMMVAAILALVAFHRTATAPPTGS